MINSQAYKAVKRFQAFRIPTNPKCTLNQHHPLTVHTSKNKKHLIVQSKSNLSKDYVS